MKKNRFFPVFLLLFFTVFFLLSCSGSEPKVPKRTGDLRKDLIAYAQSFIGTPYRAAGKSPKTGFDCSGYTAFVFKEFGYTISPTSSLQYKESARVSRKNLLPGDLVFFGEKSPQKITHVGIYAGKNKIIHAPSSGKRVEYADLSTKWYATHYLGAGRILPE